MRRVPMRLPVPHPFALCLLLAGYLAQPTMPTALAETGRLWVGAETVDITPDRPVALSGQRHVRISRQPETPISATALAIETRVGDRVIEQAVSVSCDLVAIRDGILERVREKVAARIPDLDVSKLFLAATHTHTAPVMVEGRYSLPSEGIMQPSEYAHWMTDRVADVVAAAWEKRAPGRVGWGQGQAVVARNRRVLFADGTAVMYGKTDRPEFRGLESQEDHDLDVLFFWDADDRLIATAINLPCPAQEVGGRSSINADFWHPVRERLRERYGADLRVVAWTGAAGDVTSRLMLNQAADRRMLAIRGLTRMEEIARRIVQGWEEAHEVARQDQRDEIDFRHLVAEVALPTRRLTAEEADAARREAAKYADDPAQTWNYRWNQRVVDRYERQQAGTEEPYTIEMHALRLGDVAIATNPFELFTDYGMQIKARSPAVQTMVVQLAGPGSYLPTRRAVEGGGYSAVPQSTPVGPAGGQVLVDQTVEAFRSLWTEKPND